MRQGPDAAQSRGTLVLVIWVAVLVTPPLFRALLPVSSQALPPLASPRPCCRRLRVCVSYIQHEVPSLPPIRDSVLWSCLLLVCQIAVLMLSAMSDQSANNTTG